MALDRRRLIAGLAGAWLVGPGQAAGPAMADLIFDVLRNGRTLGQHRVGFVRAGDDLTVTIEVQMVVRFALIPVFRYEHKNVERWRTGQLQGCEAQTNDDGKRRVVTVARQETDFLVEGTLCGSYRAPGDALIASHWNRDQLAGPMINPQTGQLLRPTIADRGTEDVAVAGGRRVVARRYALSGDVQPPLDLWYDDAAEWVALRFSAKDGSAIAYQRA